MSRFDDINYNVLMENLFDDLYDEISGIRSSLQDNIENMTIQQEMFWNGVYGGFLQIEELLTYINPEIELNNDDHDSDILDLEKEGTESFRQRLDIVREKVGDLIDQTSTDTAYMTGMRFSFILFHSQLRNVHSSIEDEDFEEFHVNITNLIPSPTDYIFMEGNWKETYFNQVREAGFDA
jgi:hypothetical protein